MPQFDSGAAEPIGRLSEGLLLRLLHQTFCQLEHGATGAEAGELGFEVNVRSNCP
jgi:hypothetical protein